MNDQQIKIFTALVWFFLENSSLENVYDDNENTSFSMSEVIKNLPELPVDLIAEMNRTID